MRVRGVHPCRPQVPTYTRLAVRFIGFPLDQETVNSWRMPSTCGGAVGVGHEADQCVVAGFDVEVTASSSPRERRVGPPLAVDGALFAVGLYRLVERHPRGELDEIISWVSSPSLVSTNEVRPAATSPMRKA